jgi:PST family polysaccharide transporter
MAVALAVPLLFASPYIVAALFGAKYQEASQVLSVHIWTALFTFYGSGKSIFLQCENMQLYMFITTGIGAISNIALNVILIPPFGVLGAAYATLFSQMICAIVIPLLYKRDRINVVMFIKALMFPVYYFKQQKTA